MVSAITDSGQMWSKVGLQDRTWLLILKIQLSPQGFTDGWRYGRMDSYFYYFPSALTSSVNLTSRVSQLGSAYSFLSSHSEPKTSVSLPLLPVSVPTVVGNPAELLGPGTRNHEGSKAQVVACS